MGVAPVRQDGSMNQPAFDFGAPDHPPSDLSEAADVTYTVGELAAAVNRALRVSLGDGVWVRGEIHGWSDRGKHAYFMLVDQESGDRAVMNVQFFAHFRSKLRPMLTANQLRLDDGITVRVFGHLDYFAPTGRLGLKMTGIDPRFTLGELALARDQVLRRLTESGELEANRARPLSPVPLRVGVVTSVGTAAWHDFRDEIERSGLGFRLAVADTRVQGDDAARQVARAIQVLGTRGDLDVVAVIRGGGARTELATFDAEGVARAIAASPHPVMTGLGHEVDRSVADEVAHTALKTPTACAAMLVSRVCGYRDGVEQRWQAVEVLAGRRLDESLARLTDRAHGVARRTHAAVERSDARLSGRIDSLVRRAPRILDAAGSSVDRSAGQLMARPRQLLDTEVRHLDVATARVASHDPARLLERGWSITVDDHGDVIRSVTAVAPGAWLHTRLADGTLTSRVEDST